jgi:tetratricopeptide (TPR) repeat protein
MKVKKTSFLFILLIVFSSKASLLDDANDLYSKGKIKEAAVAYKKAARQGENPTLCYFNLANAYYQLDSLAQAVVFYQASIGSAPEFFRGYLNLSIAYYALNDLGECISTARRAVALEPKNQKALFVLAAAYRKAKGFPEAITAFEQIAQFFPDMEEPYIALGEMYRELDDPGEAIRWFTQYPQNGKNLAYVQLALADIYESENNLDHAVYCLQKSFEKDPSKQWTWYRIAELDERSGNTLVALEAAKNGIELFPKFSEIALLAGTIAFKLEKYDEAERYFTIAQKNGNAGAVVGLDNIRMVRREKQVAH